MLFYPKKGEMENPRTVLFTDNFESNPQTEYFNSQNIELRAYADIVQVLSEFNEQGVKIGVTTETCNAELHRICKDVAVKADNTIKLTKMAKNQTEM